MSDSEHAILNLSADEKRAFAFLFNQADKDQLGVVTGENAVVFFERTNVSPNVLGEIWQIADTENRGLLTKPGFCMVLRLIGHYQAGRAPSTELAFKPAPVPKFEGLTIPGVGATPAPPPQAAAPTSPTAGGFPANALQPQLSGQAPIRVPPLDPAKVQQYSGLFERSGAQHGVLDGATAKAIFERAALPNEVLGRIWMAADREQRGALDQTEFIVAMHLLASMKARSMTALPNVLPQGLWDAAARRGGPPSRQGTGPVPQAIPRQLTGQGMGVGPVRTQSPLARQTGYGAPQPLSAQTSGPPWLVTPADKSKFDQFFNTIDTQGRGIISGEQAVQFFSDSRLPEETLAQIWDLSDINSEGQLNKDEFAVAMYLIRQQRAPNAAPLPTFLPPALIPPSLRKQTQQTESTAPAFNNAAQAPNMPKSAADDLFGLDEPGQSAPLPQAPALQPQGTGMSATRDPFAGGSPAPGSPASPSRQPATGIFKPFMPTSAFGASLAQQNTGSSMASSQPPAFRAPPPTANDDLLGDNDAHAAEASKITNETTELANMSNQIGNLRSQMEQTQAKKNNSQAELNQTNAQKRDLEIRLQQFRTQYEQEVRAVKEIEQQLKTSRDSTKTLGQDLAMLEGSHQDLQTQHQTISQQLQADQQENASLKQRIAELNAEITKLKPEIEKMKLEARQQKGMVSINKKQLATQEAERDRLQTEKAELEREAAEREEQSRALPAAENVAPTSTVVSPAASTLSSTNPFFRKVSDEGGARAISPQQTGSGPTPSAFDALFGPPGAFAPSGQHEPRTGTPPTTSFVGRSLPTAAPGMSDSVQSLSSAGQHTPSATPPISENPKDTPAVAEPPPPPEGGQFTSAQLPAIRPDDNDDDNETDASSTKVLPPASRAGEAEAPHDAPAHTPGFSSLNVPGSFTEDPTPETAAKENVPGAFPEDPWTPAAGLEASNGGTSSTAKDDFDSAFADFGESNKSRDVDHQDPFATSSKAATSGFGSEFPPIQTLEHEDEDSDSSDDEDARRAFDDDFTAASPPRTSEPTNVESASAIAPAVGAPEPAISTTPLPGAEAQLSPPAYEDSNKLSHGGSGERTEDNQFPAEYGGLLPAREDPTSPPPPDETPAAATLTASKEVAPDSTVQTPVQTPPATLASTNPFPMSAVTNAATASAPAAKGTSAFDDFDAFDDLAEAKEVDKSDLSFGFAENSDEFNPTFDSPAASMTTGAASSQQTPIAANHTLHQSEGSGSNGFSSVSSFQPSSSTSALGVGTPILQQIPQTSQHDWDAIFSGLDNSKQVDSSLDSSDPWGPPANGSAPKAEAATAAPRSIPIPPPPSQSQRTFSARGGAITPGTEHDDPILKRLTGMGYPRGQALEALERYDYDINRAVDHLTSQ